MSWFPAFIAPDFSPDQERCEGKKTERRRAAGVQYGRRNRDGWSSIRMASSRRKEDGRAVQKLELWTDFERLEFKRMADGVPANDGWRSSGRRTAFEQRTCHRLQQFTMITRGTEERPAIVALVMTQRILSSLLSEGDKL